MKKFAILLAFLLIPFSVFAQNYGRVHRATAAINFAPAIWHPIVLPRLAGFEPSVMEMALNSDASPCSFPWPEKYLRAEGGRCRVAYVLVNSDGEIIDSKEKLKTLGPVTNEVKAMSFVAVTEGDLSQKFKGVLEGFTKTAPGGFLVKVIKNNTFGCSRHEKTELVFKVTRQGDILLLTSKILLQPPFKGVEVCVD